MMKKRYNPPFRPASALIIAVILTSLLAIVGVMFVMVARVDRMATSAIAENKELNFAVDSVVAEISQQLALDVPRLGLGGAEYYDYPGPADPWLANLEPYLYDDKGTPDTNDDIYNWRRISNLFGGLDADDLQAEIIPDYQKSTSEIGDSNSTDDFPADADGDGVADSKWVKLENMTSNKGKPIFAAVRVIDNGAMINVNTVFANPGGPDQRKGDMLTDIYIDGLKKSPSDSITEFIDKRSNALDAATYYFEAARRIENPDTTTNFYTFYDISEELSLRNRFVLIPGQADPFMPFLSTLTRLEAYGPPSCLYYTLRQTNYGNAFAPYTNLDFGEWKRRFNPFDDGNEPNNNNYDFRHLLTTHNFDRIIDSDGSKMTNINVASVEELEDAIIAGLRDADPNFGAFNMATQIAVNLIDYRDSDSNVTAHPLGPTGLFGFERPCVYISELVHKFVQDPCDPNTVYRSYAIELYNPYAAEDNVPNDQWRLVIVGFSGATIDIDDWPPGNPFYVLLSDNPMASLVPDVDPLVTPKLVPFSFAGDYVIQLQRRRGPGLDWIPCSVDEVQVPLLNNTTGWLKIPPQAFSGVARSIKRDINPHKCIRRLWTGSAEASAPELGTGNSYTHLSTDVIQAHPADKLFTNVGEIGALLRVEAYTDINSSSTEASVRVNLADPNFQRLFRYLTVFDPNEDNIDNDGDYTIDNRELKVPGRININTAPWYVIAQLPWVSDPALPLTDPNRYKLAQAIVEHRDSPTVQGFKSIGELMNVAEIFRYIDSNDLAGFPDLTGGDGALNDFEERDVIFARISDLVTVRSDVFTAYILVRIGTDGPQKRVLAILDRSDVYPNPDYPLTSSIPYLGQVKVIAIHPVPDPR
ncbi:MAG: hypothetical protein JW947_03385 [Sedimentisphaerales bacterium]|nr:hypothetical protein [Sedimentisphaerales bacterium]